MSGVRWAQGAASFNSMGVPAPCLSPVRIDDCGTWMRLPWPICSSLGIRDVALSLPCGRWLDSQLIYTARVIFPGYHRVRMGTMRFENCPGLHLYYRTGLCSAENAKRVRAIHVGTLAFESHDIYA